MSKLNLETIETESEHKADESSVSPATPPAQSRFANLPSRRISLFRIFLCLILVCAAFAGLYFYGFGARSLSQDLSMAKLSSKEIMTTAAVKIEFSLHKRFANDLIGVSTNNGTVTLIGYVDSDKDKALAEEVVRNTRGVSDVINNLKAAKSDADDQYNAEPDPNAANLEKQSAILDALIASKDLDGQEIRVTVDNRGVALEGYVDTEQQKNIALLTAIKYGGVTEANADKLIVRRETDKHIRPGSSNKESRQTSAP